MTINAKTVLILGGARSGKSAFAQEIASSMGTKVLFCATAEPLDHEMQTRIAKHKESRPEKWDTMEVSKNVAVELNKMACKYNAIIIDCITLLVANCLGNDDKSIRGEQCIDDEISRLIECINKKVSNYILVSNEVGSGLVPDYKLGRIYRDMLGKTNQRLAKCADEVYLMVAGLPLKIK